MRSGFYLKTEQRSDCVGSHLYTAPACTLHIPAARGLCVMFLQLGLEQVEQKLSVTDR